MAAILNFQIFCKNHKNACIYARYSDFGKNFLVYPQGACEDYPFQVSMNISKMAAILNACISKTVLDRAILTKILTHRVNLLSN